MKTLKERVKKEIKRKIKRYSGDWIAIHKETANHILELLKKVSKEYKGVNNV